MGGSTNRIGALEDSMKSLSVQIADLQKQLVSFPTLAPWNDPKLMKDFIERVQAEINDPNQKIVIVPIGPR
jgi:hypothetical protein